MKGARRWIWVVTLVVILAGGAGAAAWLLRSTPAVATAAGPLVPTAKVTRGPMELSVFTTGELRAGKTQLLTAPSVGGTLRILRLLPTGTAVTTGDVIVELDPTEQTYQLEQARSELQQAEQEIVKRRADVAVQAAQDKVELLTAQFDVRRAELDSALDQDLIAANEYKRRQLTLEEARQRLTQIQTDVQSRSEANRAALTLVEERRAKAELAANRAQQNIDSLVIKAPIDGHVVVRENRDAAGGMFYSGMTLPEYRAGDNTFAGRTLADVVDLSGMELRVKVSEQDRGNVSEGQVATVKSDALPGVALPAKVKSVAGMAQANYWEMTGPMRQFDAVLALDAPDPRMRPGSTVSVTFAGQRVDNVLQVPLQAVRQKDGKPVVYVRTATGGFEARPIKVLHRTESRIGMDGIDPGTEVALVDPTAAAQTTAKAPGPAPGSGR